MIDSMFVTKDLTTCCTVTEERGMLELRACPALLELENQTRSFETWSWRWVVKMGVCHCFYTGSIFHFLGEWGLKKESVK
jgi:hypothetical protein